MVGEGKGEQEGVTKLASDTEPDTVWPARPSKECAVGEGRAKAGLGGAALKL